MKLFNRRERGAFPWRPEFQELAQYNGERARGLVHTPECDARMRQLQAEYDEALSAYNADRGVTVISGVGPTPST